MSYDESAYGLCLKDHEQEIRKALDGTKPVVFFSAYKTDENGIPINNLHDVAIEGKCILIADHDPFWSGRFGKPYESKVVENPTWLDLAVLADDMIRVTGDFHHIFFEGVHNEGNNSNGIPLYSFIMGS